MLIETPFATRVRLRLAQLRTALASDAFSDIARDRDAAVADICSAPNYGQPEHREMLLAELTDGAAMLQCLAEDLALVPRAAPNPPHTVHVAGPPPGTPCS